ncbi:MAG: hypothetical protein QM581_08280 [Pseudomonas sp.]
MADTTITCTDACTITLVHEFSLPPFQLTKEEGAQIALAIGAVWVVAWAFRMLIRVLNSGDGNQPSEGT